MLGHTNSLAPRTLCINLDRRSAVFSLALLAMALEAKDGSAGCREDAAILKTCITVAVDLSNPAIK